MRLFSWKLCSGRLCSGLLLVSLLLAGPGCSSAPPPPPGALRGVDRAVVEVLGDGFVRLQQRRMPVLAAVLELRLASRAMSAEELLGFVVQLQVDPAAADDEAAAIAAADIERLLRELEIMGVKQVRVL